MVAEGGGVVTHLGQELEFGPGFTDGASEGSSHTVVASVQNQHRPLIFAHLFSLGDQGGQTREAALGLVVVEFEWGVVRGRTHPDQVRVQVIGMQDGEGELLSVCCCRRFSG